MRLEFHGYGPQDPVPVPDSVQFFIYSDKGTHKLLVHRTLSVKTTTMPLEDILHGEKDEENDSRAGETDRNAGLKVKGAGKEKNGEDGYVVVAIAGCRTLNVEALEVLDAMELVKSSYRNDDPEHPLLSGTCTIWSDDDDDEWTLVMRPLFCKIALGNVSNTMKNYVRLEEPSVYLKNVNSDAEILRSDGFRPVELLDSVCRRDLPYDIGMYPQQPGTSTYAYPNDYEEATLGTPRTTLVLEGKIKGEICRFPVELPALKRGEKVEVDIDVSTPTEYHSFVR